MSSTRLINLISVAWFLLSGGAASAEERLHPEKWYQERDCTAWGGITEHPVPNDPTPSTPARVDCLTESHAIEFDFADKWAEAVGQSFYYAHQTGKRPGVALIVEHGDADLRYVIRIYAALAHTERKDWLVWIVRP